MSCAVVVVADVRIVEVAHAALARHGAGERSRKRAAEGLTVDSTVAGIAEALGLDKSKTSKNVLKAHLLSSMKP